jgi:hypothetical protein
MAITAATFQAYERVGGSYRVRVHITDASAAGGGYDKWLTVTGSTLTELTNDASRQIAQLAAQDTQQDLLAGIAVGTAIPITYTPQAPSADDVWLGQAKLLVRVKALQSAGASTAQLTTDIASLVATVNAGYTTARALRL